MATQPQFNTPQLRGIAQLMSSFADMAAQDRQDERDLAAMLDPREQAKREMEGALALAEIQQGQGKLDLGQKELDALTAFREGQLALEGRLGDMNSLLTAIGLEGDERERFVKMLTSDITPANLAGKITGTNQPSPLAILTSNALNAYSNMPLISPLRTMPNVNQIGAFPLGQFNNLFGGNQAGQSLPFLSPGTGAQEVLNVIRNRYDPDVMLGEDPNQ